MIIKMKEVKEKPTTGQFISVNEHDGEIWSSTHKFENGSLVTYNPDQDTWYLSDYDNPEIDYKYFIKC